MHASYHVKKHNTMPVTCDAVVPLGSVALLQVLNFNVPTAQYVLTCYMSADNLYLTEEYQQEKK